MPRTIRLAPCAGWNARGIERSIHHYYAKGRFHQLRYYLTYTISPKEREKLEQELVKLATFARTVSVRNRIARVTELLSSPTRKVQVQMPSREFMDRLDG